MPSIIEFKHNEFFSERSEEFFRTMCYDHYRTLMSIIISKFISNKNEIRGYTIPNRIHELLNSFTKLLLTKQKFMRDKKVGTTNCQQIVL